MQTAKGSIRLLLVISLLMIPFVTAYGGGWCTINLTGLPEYFVAARPTPLTFVVRAHGVTPMDGMKTGVFAKMAGENEISFATAPTGNAGEYRATVTLPVSGEWTLRVDSGYMGIPFSLVPMKAVAAGSPPLAPISQIERGERLFVTQGCIGCHVNKDVRSTNIASIGPILTGKSYPTEVLKTFLADPGKYWKALAEKRESQMPDLHLATGDIDAIVAFMNRPRT